MAVYCMENPISYDLSCPICFEEYDILSVQRAPKLLLCLHTFCYGCTQQLWRADGTLECSLCRTVHYEVTLADLFDNPVIFQHLRKKNEEEDLEYARTLDRELRRTAERNASNGPTEPKTNQEPPPPAEQNEPATCLQEPPQPQPPVAEPQPAPRVLHPPLEDLIIPPLEDDSVDEVNSSMDEVDSVDGVEEIDRVDDVVERLLDSVDGMDNSVDEVDFLDRVESVDDGLDFLDRVDDSVDGQDYSVHEVEDSVEEVDDSVQIISDDTGIENEEDLFNLASPLFEDRDDDREWNDPEEEDEEVFHSARGGFISPSCADEFSNDEGDYDGDDGDDGGDDGEDFDYHTDSSFGSDDDYDFVW